MRTRTVGPCATLARFAARVSLFVAFGLADLSVFTLGFFGPLDFVRGAALFLVPADLALAWEECADAFDFL
jgi:hypothetical protein